MKSALARKIKDALDRFVTNVEAAIDHLETGLSQFARLRAGASTDAEQVGKTEAAKIADDIYERVDDGALETVQEVEAAIDDALDPIVDALATALQRYVEQGAPISGQDGGAVTGLNGSLDYLHDELTVEAAETGLRGDIEGAREAKEAAYTSISLTTGDAAELLDRFGRLADGLDTVKTFVDTMGDVTPQSGIRDVLERVKGMIALVKDLVGIITEALETGVGVAALDSIARDHHEGIKGVIDGAHQ